MIQAVTADGSDQPFHVGPLPWTGWRGDDFLYAQALDSLPKVIPMDLIPVSQQVTWRLILGKRLHPLLPCPPCRRVLRHVEVNDAAAMMSQHDKHEQHPKPTAGTVKKSTETKCWTWLFRKALQV